MSRIFVQAPPGDPDIAWNQAVSPFVSYFEIGLDDAALCLRLGSGPAEEIIGRSQTDPSLRICIREPTDDSVGFRARCGIAEMTPEGPAPMAQDDPTQQRGAWIRMLPIGWRISSLLRDWFGRANSMQVMVDGMASGWLAIDESKIRAVDSFVVSDVLAGPLTDTQGHVFVRLGGTLDQVTRALELLHEPLPEARYDEWGGSLDGSY